MKQGKSFPVSNQLEGSKVLSVESASGDEIEEGLETHLGKCLIFSKYILEMEEFCENRDAFVSLISRKHSSLFLFEGLENLEKKED